MDDWLVTSMDEAMDLQRVAPRELFMADVALIRFFPRVDAQVPLQLEVVSKGFCAVRTLVRPLPRVATHVPLQL